MTYCNINRNKLLCMLTFSEIFAKRRIEVSKKREREREKEERERKKTEQRGEGIEANESQRTRICSGVDAQGAKKR